jgi:hypothetical protein
LAGTSTPWSFSFAVAQGTDLETPPGLANLQQHE